MRGRTLICNERCANYLIIKNEGFITNNICEKCRMKNSNTIKAILELNKMR